MGGPKVSVDSQSALVVVDVQRDFCQGGALYVPHGDEVVSVMNRYIEIFEAKKAPIYVTRDWHPRNHISFKAQGGPWPPHCVQNSRGAEFHPDLKVPAGAEIISKGDTPPADAYSDFDGTDFVLRLRSKGIRKLFVGGLATDYCVGSTVLDALYYGFTTYFLADGSRGVDVKRRDSARAIEKMIRSGARSITLRTIDI